MNPAVSPGSLSLGFGVLESYHLSTNCAAPFWTLFCICFAMHFHMLIIWAFLTSVFSFCPNFYIYFPHPYAHKSFQGKEYLHMHTNMCPCRHFGFDSHNFVREMWLVLFLICWWRNWALVDLTTVTWLVKIARVTLDSRSSNFNSTFLKLPHWLFLYLLLKKPSNDAP